MPSVASHRMLLQSCPLWPSGWLLLLRTQRSIGRIPGRTRTCKISLLLRSGGLRPNRKKSQVETGDVVVGMLPGAAETKVRPAVVIASDIYLVERPDVLVGILTTKLPRRASSMDYVLLDWQRSGLRSVSCFRAYVLTIHRSNLTVVGHLSEQDWTEVKARVRIAFA